MRFLQAAVMMPGVVVWPHMAATKHGVHVETAAA
jgi:hypothetical protein